MYIYIYISADPIFYKMGSLGVCLTKAVLPNRFRRKWDNLSLTMWGYRGPQIWVKSVRGGWVLASWPAKDVFFVDLLLSPVWHRTRHAKSVDFASMLSFWRHRGFAESDSEAEKPTFFFNIFTFPTFHISIPIWNASGHILEPFWLILGPSWPTLGPS